MRSLFGRLDLCSINTATLGHKVSIESVIDDVARFGFGGMCPWRRDLDRHDVTAVSRRIRDAGLKVSGYCRSTYLPALTREDFQANVEDNRMAIDQAATLGAQCLVVGGRRLPTGSREPAGSRKQLVEGVVALFDHP